MTLHLPIEVANQILGYLGTRPYQEVFQLIQAIQDAAKPREAPSVPQVDAGTEQEG
jgi:hypothetical protein